VKARAERDKVPIDASGVRALVERAGLISSGFAVLERLALYRWDSRNHRGRREAVVTPSADAAGLRHRERHPA